MDSLFAIGLIFIRQSTAGLRFTLMKVFFDMARSRLQMQHTK